VTSGGGLLELRFARSLGDSTARLVERRQRFPLHLTTPLYPDLAAPDMAHVYVQNPSGGVFPGDQLALQVAADAGAAVHVTTTAATKVYGGDGDEARAETTFRIGAGAYLEHVPDPLIPHAGARYVERLRVELASGAAFVGVQGIAPGRVAHGEEFRYKQVDLRTEVIGASGEELYVDRILLEPNRIHPARRGLLAGAAYVGNLLAVAPGRDAAALTASLDVAVAAYGAASELPFGAGAFARVLASSAPALRTTLQAGWAAARQALLGLEPTVERR
jgi:urease accessory protein